MNAVALLHPGVSSRVVERFNVAGVEVSIQDHVDPAISSSAALIFGGDGTVHRHLSQLHKQKIPALVVPTGSGNDFAKALGITSAEVALRAWKQFCAGKKNVREIDLGVIRPGNGTGHNALTEEILFCGVTAIGMDADANARANRLPAWMKGKGGYLLAALRALIAFRPAEIGVATAGRNIRNAAFFVAVANAHRYGGGMKIAPRAAMNDGLLDICYVARMNKLKLLCWVPTIFFGRHLGLTGVEYLQAQTVQIDADRTLEVYADGDYACRTPVQIGVVTKGLSVIVPA